MGIGFPSLISHDGDATMRPVGILIFYGDWNFSSSGYRVDEIVPSRKFLISNGFVTRSPLRFFDIHAFFSGAGRFSCVFFVLANCHV
jgi:hypothetical protein